MSDGLFSKLKVLIGIEEIEDDEDYEENPEQSNSLERKSVDVRSFNSIGRIESKEVRDNRVVPMQNKNANPNTTQMKMVVIEPKSFDDCPKLVDSLKSRKPIIINLEKIDTDTARKIFDFLSGATYAINGNVQKVANNIFIFAPENVDVSGNIDHSNIGFDGSPKNVWR
ncbi:MAG: cell division protein SepF [Anaerovoracaceae bacterium]